MTLITEIMESVLTIHLLLCLLTLSSFSLVAIATSKTDLSALLSFKSQIHDDPFGVLSSWNESLHHCQWQGILCGQLHPDRVTALVLDSKQLSGYISPSLANLSFLQRMSLSDNQLRGSIPVEIGYLGRLRFVNLSVNFLDGSIPSTLSNCSNLEVISLRYNNLHGTIPSNLAQCKELKNINLANNFLTGDIPLEFGLLPQLELLGLFVNNLTGSIPSTLGNLSSLKYLYLHQNLFDGDIPDSLGKLADLSELYLYNNKFTGFIPPTLGNHTKLSILYLHKNNISGHIPPGLGNLTNLLELYLYENKFYGTIPHTLGNLQSLTGIDLSTNMLSGFIPDELGKLQNLQFFNIYQNNISGEIPHSLYNISALSTMELGNNQLDGNLPFDMCNALPNLKNLYLYINQLQGRIPPSISNCSALIAVELGDNYFSGVIPSSFGALQNLNLLHLEFNQLEAKGPHDWNFMDALTNCTLLQLLHLSNNQLQGVLPSSITNLSNSLLELSLDSNPISGSMPAEFRKLNNLNFLDLSRMFLSGSIPVEIGNLSKLEALDLSNNMISGQIPSTFSNLTQMTLLYLENNVLEGGIPPELSSMKLLILLNFSNNKLAGEIPKEIMGLPSLSISLDLSHNYLTGILSPEIGYLKNLQSIHLSNNKLSGEIPSTIDGCQELQSLYLDSNLLRGTIPSSLSKLIGLQILDVSNNSFSGRVPEFLATMNLQYLNISFNNFEGELPKEGIFKNASGLDVRGNPKLCGGVPQMHLSQCISQPSTQRHHFRRNLVLISSVGSFICITAIICLLVIYYNRKNPQNKPQSDKGLKYGLEPVSYNDLLRATEKFSRTNLIGRGSFGEVYKAVMSFENVTTVAVKVLNLEKHSASRSFFSECETLRNVRHRNLIKVLSLCSSIDHQGNDFKALVFEFMPNGSLATWLHPNACTDRPFRSLSFIQRLNIAFDVATALDYLHYHLPAPIVHCDLKPSNVLLDDDMTALVSDFGLARFLVQPDTMSSQSMSSTSGIKGSIGYIPPEYGMGGRPSVEGDVYSYGVILLEIFTGVSPTDERIRDGLSLQNQVEMAFPDQVMDIVDPKLFSETDGEHNLYVPENVYSCLVSVIQCGLMCSKEYPKERISIKDVIKELNSARTKVLRP
ncbi:receptor kinase-like protein Xa21 [Carex rostrata]